jgi:outer membrane protein OmpA-like peptidoglycan-associated protein
LSPSFDYKTHRLYYASNGRPSIGGFDIFESIGERSRWMYPAKNAGNQINSSYDDLYYVPHPLERDKALVVSNREGSTALKHNHCCDDIFELTWKNLTEVKLEITALDMDLDSPVVPTDLLLTVRDSPEGEILVIDRIRTDSMGRVTFSLEPGLDYTIISESDQYFNKKIEFKAPETDENVTVSKKIELSKIPDEEIVIPNIYYPFDKAYLTPEAQIALDTSIYELLLENPTIIVEISSHTDSKGSEKYNQHLSQRRAQSVVNYLMSKGIDKKRLEAKGYGESQPIAPNTNEDGSDNPTGRAKNRRTGFRVIGQLDVDIYYEED